MCHMSTYTPICFQDCNFSNTLKMSQSLLVARVHLAALKFIPCSQPAAPPPCSTRCSKLYATTTSPRRTTKTSLPPAPFTSLRLPSPTTTSRTAKFSCPTRTPAPSRPSAPWPSPPSTTTSAPSPSPLFRCSTKSHDDYDVLIIYHDIWFS